MTWIWSIICGILEIQKSGLHNDSFGYSLSNGQNRAYLYFKLKPY